MVIAAALLALTSPPALAEKWTISCTFEIGSGGEEHEVNQLFIDTDRPLVELRVAQTMGTKNERKWTYENKPDRSIRFVTQAPWGPWIGFAATRSGLAVVIGFNKGTGRLNWIFADGTLYHSGADREPGTTADVFGPGGRCQKRQGQLGPPAPASRGMLPPTPTGRGKKRAAKHAFT